MSERKKFTDEAIKPGANLSALCRQAGISRTTGRLWRDRRLSLGLEGLANLSRRPKHSPAQTDHQVEALALSIRDKHPHWGGVKIHRYLTRQGYCALPSEKTIDRILKRHGRITAEASEKHRAWQRFEHEHPNDLWQMDFKGYVTIGGTIYHPLTLLDDHSRFLLLAHACTDQRSDTVKQALIKVFKRYGLPKRMTMDNGPPWGYSGAQEHTSLCAWLMRLGIQVSHSRPGHPQTQGKLERLHRTLNEELLQEFSFESGAEFQRGLDYFRWMYNEERPHGALDYAVPVERYQSSARAYPKVMNPITYSAEYEVRKVSGEGEISYRGHRYRVGEAFKGYPVGLKVSQDSDDLMEVYFCQQKVLLLDLKLAAK